VRFGCWCAAGNTAPTPNPHSINTGLHAKLLREIAAAGFGIFEEIRNKKIFTLNGQLSSTVINCHQLDDSSKTSRSKALTESCHQMTKVYISENFDSPTKPSSKALIDESVLKPVENSENLEDIQFCHLMTVEAESIAPHLSKKPSICCHCCRLLPHSNL
jgi:hypothetical protein